MGYIPAGRHQQYVLWKKAGLRGFTQGGDESACNLAVEVCGVGKQHAMEIAELQNWKQAILTREIDEGQRDETQFVGVKEEVAGKKVWMLVKPGAQELPQQALTAVGAFFLLCGKMRGELPQEDSCVEVKARSQHPKRERKGKALKKGAVAQRVHRKEGGQENSHKGHKGGAQG
jgi:hypothetical protein